MVQLGIRVTCLEQSGARPSESRVDDRLSHLRNLDRLLRLNSALAGTSRAPTRRQ
jgi:hypothetical protein